MNNTAKIRSLCLAASTLILLAACGGGDGGAPELSSVNVDAAITKAYTSGFSPAGGTVSGLTGTDKAGNVYTMSITQSTAAGVAVVGGEVVSRQTIVMTRPGGAVTTSMRDTFFTPAPFTAKRYVGGNGQVRVYESAVALPAAPLPTAAPVGAKGTLNTYTVYPSSTVNIPVGVGVTTWSIEPDTATTAFVCLTHSAPPVLPETFCYRTDASGAVTGAKVTISINDELVSFK